jgi:hypothetical protein
MSARSRSNETRTSIVTFRPIALGETIDTFSSITPFYCSRFNRRWTPVADNLSYSSTSLLVRRLLRCASIENASVDFVEIHGHHGAATKRSTEYKKRRGTSGAQHGRSDTKT